jgi:hypothetical protein
VGELLKLGITKAREEVETKAFTFFDSKPKLHICVIEGDHVWDNR